MIPLSHYLQWTISDVVGKHGRILGVVIFIFDINFENVSNAFVEIVQQGANV